MILGRFLVILSFVSLLTIEAEEKMPTLLRSFLQKHVRLSNQDIEFIQVGLPVARALKTESKDEVAIFGIIRINVSPEFLMERLRNITEFEQGPGIRATGIFHSPPTLNDVAQLEIDPEELKEIPKCKPGSCRLKLSDTAMRILREQIDWRSIHAPTRAQALIRQLLVDYVANYQKIGDEALSVYYDKEEPQVIRDGLHQLLQNSVYLYDYDRQLANYLEKFPAQRPENTEDIFYWQKVDFGLKPVIRISHMVIHQNHHSGYVTYAIASKMLFASHYFRAALELKSVIPDPPQQGASSLYFACLNRSFVDGLTGLKGAFLRGTISERSRVTLERHLRNLKVKLETQTSH